MKNLPAITAKVHKLHGTVIIVIINMFGVSGILKEIANINDFFCLFKNCLNEFNSVQFSIIVQTLTIDWLFFLAETAVSQFNRWIMNLVFVVPLCINLCLFVFLYMCALIQFNASNCLKIRQKMLNWTSAKLELRRSSLLNANTLCLRHFWKL